MNNVFPYSKKNLNRGFFYVINKECKIEKAIHITFFILSNFVLPVSSNFFYVNLNHIFDSKKRFFLTCNSTRGYFEVPKILLDRDNPNGLQITVITREDICVRKKLEIIKFKLFIYEEDFQYCPPFHFNCFDLAHNMEMPEFNNDYYVVGFKKASSDCQGIDLIFNKRTKLAPAEEKIIRIVRLFKSDTHGTYETNLFVLRSSAIRAGVEILDVRYEQDDVYITIVWNKPLKSDNELVLGVRIIQICLPIINESILCFPHLELNNKPRKPKMSSDDSTLIPKKRYEEISLEKVVDNFKYIVTKTLFPSEEYKKRKAIESVHFPNIKNNIPKEYSTGDEISREITVGEVSEKRIKLTRKSMTKLCEQLMLLLVTIFSEIDGVDPEIIDNIEETFKINKLTKEEKATRSIKTFDLITMIDGHVAEGKSTKVDTMVINSNKEAIAMAEMDNIFRLADALILKKYTDLIPIMYFCRFHVMCMNENSGKATKLIVDRSPLSNYIFGMMYDFKNNVFVSNERPKIFDCFAKEDEEFFPLDEMIAFMAIINGGLTEFKIQMIPDNELKAIKEWKDYRAYEKDYYADKNFEMFRKNFRLLMKHILDQCSLTSSRFNVEDILV